LAILLQLSEGCNDLLYCATNGEVCGINQHANCRKHVLVITFVLFDVDVCSFQRCTVKTIIRSTAFRGHIKTRMNSMSCFVCTDTSRIDSAGHHVSEQINVLQVNMRSSWTYQ